MSKNSIKRFSTVLAAITLFSAAHLASVPSEGLNEYLAIFALFYVIVATISIILAVKLSGSRRILMIVSGIVAICLLAYDLFGIALGAMQF